MLTHAMPADVLYVPYYCEENVWQLLSHPVLAAREAEVAFLSNPARTVALWNQKTAGKPGDAIAWDYHALAFVRDVPDPARKPRAAEVWDLECAVGCPLAARVWWEETFPLHTAIDDDLQPLFRVLPGDVYLSTFSSDRSHMRLADGSWRQAPPPWHTIHNGHDVPTLPRFIDMADEFVGEVLTMDGFALYLGLDPEELKKDQ